MDPEGCRCPRNYLYRNQGNGTFRDVSEESEFAKAPRTYSMTAVAADFSNDGWTDLYMASDSSPSLLLRNKHNSTFVEEDAERGVAFSADGAEQAGMRVAVGDYSLDGNLDIFKTRFRTTRLCSIAMTDQPISRM